MPFAFLQTGWRPLVPLIAVGVLALGTAAGFEANAAGGPPARSADQLIADLDGLDPPGYSGVVVQKANLLSAAEVDDGAQLSLSTLLSGTHTIKVWYGGPDKQRIAVLAASGESDLFRDGSQTWQWDSETRRATQAVARGSDDPADRIPVDGTAVTPDDLARRAVAAIGPDTSVRVAAPTVVAGRSAYRLVITPEASSDTRIGRIELALDGDTRMPLAAQVYARGGSVEPAIDLSFTRISLEVPDDQTFRFTPPRDAEVNAFDANDPTAGDPDPLLGPLATTTSGTGWTRVALITPGSVADTTRAALVAQFGRAVSPVSGTWGDGELLQTGLLSMLFLDSGRIVVGAVDPDALYAAIPPDA